MVKKKKNILIKINWISNKTKTFLQPSILYYIPVYLCRPSPFILTVRPWDARFLGNEKTRASARSVQLEAVYLEALLYLALLTIYKYVLKVYENKNAPSELISLLCEACWYSFRVASWDNFVKTQETAVSSQFPVHVRSK